MAKKYDHIHKYQRAFPWGRKRPIHRCMIPGCTHHIDSKLILNRITECWRCGNPMVIGQYAARLAKPHCDNCIVSQKGPVINKLAELFEKDTP